MPAMEQLQPYMYYIVMGINGLIAGWLAALLLGGGGLLRDLIVGLIGSFVGGMMVSASILKLPYDFNTIIPTYGNQIAVSTVGAVLVLIVARIIAR
jgi:uncharacterized membrane protein YeaQ/YmgE (transglycosylase-associated protein family)